MWRAQVCSGGDLIVLALRISINYLSDVDKWQENYIS